MARRTFTDAATITEDAAQIVAQNTTNLAITPFEVTDTQALTAPLMGLRGHIDAAAHANVATAIIQSGQEFTALEIEAMENVEALHLVNGVDLTAVFLRAHYIMRIQQRNLLANHPAGYTSLDHMARENGMTITSLSQTLDMVNIIFPYVQNELGIPVSTFWERLGSSKIKEILAVLKAIITGSEPDRAQTRAAVVAALDEADDILQTQRPDLYPTNRELTENERAERTQLVRAAAVDNVVTMAEGAETVHAVRQAIRPNRTPPVDAYMLEIDGINVLVMQPTADQIDFIRARLGERMNTVGVELPAGRRARTQSIRAIPGAGKILEAIGFEQ